MLLDMYHEAASKEIFEEGVETRPVNLNNAWLIDVRLRFLLNHTVEALLPPGKQYLHLKGNCREEKVDTS